MARYLLGATIYIEDLISRAANQDLSLEERENVEKYFENPKNFNISKRKNEENAATKNIKRIGDKTSDEIEAGLRLMIKFAGFEEVDPSALEKLKNVCQVRLITAARQMSAGERRRRDGFDLPYKSPLEWTLKLQGIQKVLEIKEWYDVTYLTRFRALKMQLIDEEGKLKTYATRNPN